MKLDIDIYKIGNNTIFYRKGKLFLKCKLLQGKYDYKKAYFENYYNHTKANFLLKYHSITQDYLYFEFPHNTTCKFKFYSEYDFSTSMSKLINFFYKKEKELNKNHPYILRVKELHDKQQKIDNDLILKELKKHIDYPENIKFYINVVTNLRVNDLIINRNTNQFFFINYNNFGIDPLDIQRIEFDNKDVWI